MRADVVAAAGSRRNAAIRWILTVEKMSCARKHYKANMKLLQDSGDFPELDGLLRAATEKILKGKLARDVGNISEDVCSLAARSFSSSTGSSL